MRNNLRKVVVATGVLAALTIPASAAYAATQRTGPGQQAGISCTYDQSRDQLRLHDGTGVPTTADPAGHAYRSGPMDGTGPQADRALDGTGNSWGHAGE